MVLLCLISGASGSGKTTLATRIKQKIISLDNDNSCRTAEDCVNTSRRAVALLHQDHYFTQPFLPYSQRIDDSYENSSGIDWDNIINDIQTLAESMSAKSAHDHSTNNDDQVSQLSVPSGVILVEGHLLGDMLTNTQNMRTPVLSSFKNCEKILIVLIKCPKETCKSRRLERKKDRTKEERDELENYIDNIVWPSFLIYGIESTEALKNYWTCHNVNSTNSKSRKEKVVLLEINTETTDLNDSVEEVVHFLKTMET